MAAEDFPGDRSTPSQLALNGSIDGTIELPGDTDWFAITLIHGVAYSFTVKAVGDDGTPLADPAVLLFDRDGQPIDGSGESERFSAPTGVETVTPLKSGLYFVEVNSLTGEGTGDYRLSVAVPVVEITGITLGEGNEGATLATVSLRLSEALDVPVTVKIKSANGTAEAGIDYKGLDAVVVFPAGATEAGLGLTVIGDGEAETDETFSIVLTDIAGAAIATPSATVTIRDDDPLPVLFLDGGSHRGSLTDDTIVASVFGDEVDGSDGDDLLFGLAGPDHLAGGEGGDFLLGDFPDADGGDDSIEGESGNDVVYGGVGDDIILGLAGNDTLVGEAGDDRLEGGDGFNLLFGNDGADLLRGGPGEDYLFGEQGRDRLEAGAGNDRVHVDASDIFAGGGEGIFDVLVILGAGLTTINLDNPINQSGGIAGLVLTGFEVVDGSLAAEGINVTGARLNGNGNVLFGSVFDDILFGSHAVDVIAGGAGSDTLEGLAGNDTIIADGGNDFLAGNEGNDVFRFTGAVGNVEIVDFGIAHDRVEIPAGIGLSVPEILSRASDGEFGAEIALAPGLTIRLAGIAAADLRPDDIVVF